MKVKNKVAPNEEQINGFLENPEIGPISMVNLLKYKEMAIYEDGRDTDLTGEEAYGLYAAEVINLVEKYGGEFVFSGKVKLAAVIPIPKTAIKENPSNNFFMIVICLMFKNIKNVNKYAVVYKLLQF